MNVEALKPSNSYEIWGLTGTLVWSAIIAISFVLIQIVTMIVFIGVENPAIKPEDLDVFVNQNQLNGLFLSFATLATFIGCSLIMLGVIKLKKGANIQHYLGLNLVDVKTVRFWFLVFIVMMLFSELLTYLLGKPLVPEFVTSIYTSTDSIWLLWLAIVIAAPVFEELFFRGFIITGLSKTFMGPLGAIILSSLTWAAIHVQYDLYLIVTIFVFGLVLGFVRLKTNSVLLTIALHGFMNLMSMIETAIIT